MLAESAAADNRVVVNEHEDGRDFCGVLLSEKPSVEPAIKDAASTRKNHIVVAFEPNSLAFAVLLLLVLVSIVAKVGLLLSLLLLFLVFSQS